VNEWRNGAGRSVYKAMKRFLYFIENCRVRALEEVLAHAPALAYAFPRGESFTPAECTRGPDGAAGILCAHGDGSGLKFDEATQTWLPHSPGIWLCVPKDKAARPGPDDLERKQRGVGGHWILLGDGKNWRVPVIRFLNGNTELPRVLVLENGRGVYKMREEFAALFSVAQQLSDRVFAGEAASIGPDDLLWFASETLALNYRVSAAEVSALELLDSNNIRDVADAALDGPNLKLFIEEVKKKLSSAESKPGPDCSTGAAV
jgi:hypothetical protein